MEIKKYKVYVDEFIESLDDEEKIDLLSSDGREYQGMLGDPSIWLNHAKETIISQLGPV